MSDVVSRCLVYCRLRPSNAKDFEDGGYQLVSLEKKRVAVKDERHYDFDGTFDGDSKQQDVFETIAVPCLNHAFNGFCSALMCYGQTGTGKSFTMCCTKPGLEGIIPRSAKHLFSKIAEDSSKIYTVTAQFIQIYRDQLGDLMTEGGRDKVDIHFEKEVGVTLTGCSSHELHSEEEFMAFYDAGNARRVVTATAMNPESSRGHSAMIVIIESRDANDETGPKVKGKITFIDLAGYERFSKTGISNSNPIMKDEAKTINASLLSLGHVVSALSNGDKHIPWRNAKLTRLLQDSIGGRSRTSIILTIGPSSESLHETTNSLQFGQRAMAVKVSAKVNVTTDYEKLAAKLQYLLDERDEKINLLEVQIRSRDAERSEIAERHQRDDEELRERFRQEIEQLRQNGGSIEQLRKAEDVFQVEVENLKEQQMEEVQYQEEQHNKQIVSLAAEQQRRERKKQVELQVAQERIIAEFERKMNSMGGNGELVNALRQLSEKDSLLASRATALADLQERVAELSAMLTKCGVSPPEFEDLEETFIDMSQLEEIQKRLESEIEHHRNASVSLRAQLEVTTEQLDARAAEVVALHNDIQKYQKTMEEMGCTANEGAASPLIAPRGFVDSESLESLRMLMQEEIDKLNSENQKLKEELLSARSSALDHPQSKPETPRIGRARAMSRVENRTLPRKSDEADRDKKALQDKIGDLEKRLVSLSREYNLSLKHNELLQEVCATNNLAVTENVLPDPAAGVSAMETLVSIRDAEVSRLLDIIRKQEEFAAVESQDRQRLEECVSQLKNLVEANGVKAPPLPTVMVSDSHRACIETVMGFVRDARQSATITLSAARCDADAKEMFIESLKAKDEMLTLRENTIIEKEMLSGKLASAVCAMKLKLESLGASADLNDEAKDALAVAQEMHDMAVSQATKRIEEDLKRQKDEKEKLESVLQAMSAERQKEAQLISNAKQELEQRTAQSKALEQNLSQQREALESASVDSQSLMGIVVDLKQQLVDKEAELDKITKTLMKLQAERATNESESIFAVVKRKLRD